MFGHHASLSNGAAINGHFIAVSQWSMFMIDIQSCHCNILTVPVLSSVIIQVLYRYDIASLLIRLSLLILIIYTTVRRLSDCTDRRYNVMTFNVKCCT